MGKKKAEKQPKEVMDVLELNVSTLEVHIVGTSPMLFNAMSMKAKREFVFPAKKKTRAEKETTLKHDPVEEYRSSIYRSRSDDAPTRIVFPGGGMKACISQAGVDVPGAAKAKLGRLLHVVETDISVWGVPELHMAVVRMAGPAKTPDMRTRAVLPRWCSRFRVRFVTPNLNTQAVVNLIAASGMIVGLGDYRPEKGKGSYGQFRLADPDDAELLDIMKSGGVEAQDAALEDPVPYDHETETLLEWYNAEVARRGFRSA